MWKEYNPNPESRRTGDCSVRAVSKALDTDWDTAFLLMMIQAYTVKDMPSDNSVWGAVLKQHGFAMKTMSDECPDCYTAEEFCRDFPEGTYVLGFGNHTCCVIDGCIYDAWDSSKEIVQYVWYKKEEKNKYGVPEQL